MNRNSKSKNNKRIMSLMAALLVASSLLFGAFASLGGFKAYADDPSAEATETEPAPQEYFVLPAALSGKLTEEQILAQINQAIVDAGIIKHFDITFTMKDGDQNFRLEDKEPQKKQENPHTFTYPALSNISINANTKQVDNMEAKKSGSSAFLFENGHLSILNEEGVVLNITLYQYTPKKRTLTITNPYEDAYNLSCCCKVYDEDDKEIKPMASDSGFEFTVMEGEYITIEIDPDYAPLDEDGDPYELTSFSKWTVNYTEYSKGLLTQTKKEIKKSIFNFVVPGGDIQMYATFSEDQDKKSAQESIEESINASIEAEKHLQFGVYDILIDLTDLSPTGQFIKSTESSNFHRTVDVFYHTGYQIYVYYASKNNEPYSYFLYDPLKKNLVPYVTLGGNDNSFAVIPVENSFEIPGTFIAETTVNFSMTGGTMVSMPGYRTMDDYSNEIRVVYLADKYGNRDFHVFSDLTGSITLIPWDDYLKKISGEDTDVTEATFELNTEADASSIGTEETVSEEQTESETKEETKTKKISQETLTWILICVAIALLIVAAVVIVTILNKQQEAEEEALDHDLRKYYRKHNLPEVEEDSLLEEEEEADDDEMKSGYNQEKENKREFSHEFNDDIPEEINGEQTQILDDIHEKQLTVTKKDQPSDKTQEIHITRRS